MLVQVFLQSLVLVFQILKGFDAFDFDVADGIGIDIIVESRLFFGDVCFNLNLFWMLMSASFLSILVHLMPLLVSSSYLLYPIVCLTVLSLRFNLSVSGFVLS